MEKKARKGEVNTVDAYLECKKLSIKVSPHLMRPIFGLEIMYNYMYVLFTYMISTREYVQLQLIHLISSPF